MYDIPAGVKSRGKREKTPDTDAKVKVRKYALFSAAIKLGEMSTTKIFDGT
jgi:hypothetical protein